MCAHVRTQNRIDTRLVTRPGVLKKFNDIFIDSKRDQFFRMREVNRLYPNSVGAKRRIAGVNLIVWHGCDCLKLCTFIGCQWRWIVEVKS